MKNLIAKIVIVVVVFVAGFCLWVADRPSDVSPPAVSGFIFDPAQGPQTPDEAKVYVDKRIKNSWWREYGRPMTPSDRQSDTGQRFEQEAIETLQYRWGLTLDMSEEQAKAAVEEKRKNWRFVEQSRTFRFKVRSMLGMIQ